MMSLRGCSLLQEAIDDMGSWGYILGARPTPALTSSLTPPGRNLCRPLRSMCIFPVAAHNHDGVLNHLRVRRAIPVVIATVGTTLIEGRTPIGPGALVVSRPTA